MTSNCMAANYVLPMHQLPFIEIVTHLDIELEVGPIRDRLPAVGGKA